MARPGVCLAVSCAVSGVESMVLEVLNGDCGAGGRSHLPRSVCPLVGRPELPCVGERGRLREAVVVGMWAADGEGDEGVCCAVSAVGVGVYTRGRVRRLSPGEAGLSRRRIAVAVVDDDEASWEISGVRCADVLLLWRRMSQSWNEDRQ